MPKSEKKRSKDPNLIGVNRTFSGKKFDFMGSYSNKKEAKETGLEMKKRNKKIRFRIIRTPKTHRTGTSEYDLLVS